MERGEELLLQFLGAGKGKLQGGGAHGKRLSAGKKFWASRLGAGGSASMGKKAPALAVWEGERRLREDVAGSGGAMRRSFDGSEK